VVAGAMRAPRQERQVAAAVRRPHRRRLPRPEAVVAGRSRRPRRRPQEAPAGGSSGLHRRRGSARPEAVAERSEPEVAGLGALPGAAAQRPQPAGRPCRTGDLRRRCRRREPPDRRPALRPLPHRPKPVPPRWSRASGGPAPPQPRQPRMSCRSGRRSGSESSIAGTACCRGGRLAPGSRAGRRPVSARSHSHSSCSVSQPRKSRSHGRSGWATIRASLWVEYNPAPIRLSRHADGEGGTEIRRYVVPLPSGGASRLARG
jgi:hypothetical protein